MNTLKFEGTKEGAFSTVPIHGYTSENLSNPKPMPYEEFSSFELKSHDLEDGMRCSFDTQNNEKLRETVKSV